ncbi:transmembrane glycoprotein NMB [Mantella aurantiaca]
MAICSFFLQGRCRYGDKCWNEHPKGGHRQDQSRYHYQQPSAGSRTWTSSNQKYVQPSSFAKSSTWSRDGSQSSYSSHSDSYDDRSRHNSGSSTGLFSSQNRFSSLPSQDHSRETQPDKDGSLFEDIKRDLDSWESSGQWIFSSYCVIKDARNLTGFAEISPEELRLECYTARDSGNVQNYVNSVQQLASQWKQRINAIKNTNISSQAALMNELTKPVTSSGPTFGGQQKSAFPNTSTSTISAAPSSMNFSFKQDSQYTAPSTAPVSSFPSTSGFANNAVTGSAASFSFATTPASDGASSGFSNAKAVTAATFSFAPTTSSGAGASAFPGFAAATSALPASTSSTTKSIFGGTTTTSGFGQSTIPAFGGTSGFGGGAGNAASTSGFGALAGNTASTGFGVLVGNAASTSGFGAPAGNAASSGFGALAGNTTSTSGFGVAGNAVSTSGFGGVAGNAASTSGFGALAGNTASTSGFGALAGNTGSTSGFGAPAGNTGSTSGFGALAGTTVTSGFGAKTSAVSELFRAGAASSATSVPFGQPSGVLASRPPSLTTTAESGSGEPIFTLRSELSARELSQFESKKFTIGNIPLRPPPSNLLIVLHQNECNLQNLVMCSILELLFIIPTCKLRICRQAIGGGQSLKKCCRRCPKTRHVAGDGQRLKKCCRRCPKTRHVAGSGQRLKKCCKCPKTRHMAGGDQRLKKCCRRCPKTRHMAVGGQSLKKCCRRCPKTRHMAGGGQRLKKCCRRCPKTRHVAGGGQRLKRCCRRCPKTRHVAGGGQRLKKCCRRCPKTRHMAGGGQRLKKCCRRCPKTRHMAGGGQSLKKCCRRCPKTRHVAGGGQRLKLCCKRCPKTRHMAGGGQRLKKCCRRCSKTRHVAGGGQRLKKCCRKCLFAAVSSRGQFKYCCAGRGRYSLCRMQAAVVRGFLVLSIWLLAAAQAGKRFKDVAEFGRTTGHNPHIRGLSPDSSSWDESLYPVWKSGDARWENCWRGGKVVALLTSDSPALIGSNVTFAVNLQFPRCQKENEDGDIVYECGNASSYQDQYVYNWTKWIPFCNEGNCSFSNKFPDGRHFPHHHDWRRHNFIYIFQTLGQYYQTTGRSSAALSINTTNITAGAQIIEVTVFRRGYRKHYPVAKASGMYIVTDQIPFFVNMSQKNDKNSSDHIFIKDSPIQFDVLIHDPSHYLNTSILSFNWSYGDGSGSFVSNNPVSTHTYTLLGNFTLNLTIKAAIPGPCKPVTPTSLPTTGAPTTQLPKTTMPQTTANTTGNSTKLPPFETETFPLTTEEQNVTTHITTSAVTTHTTIPTTSVPGCFIYRYGYYSAKITVTDGILGMNIVEMNTIKVASQPENSLIDFVVSCEGSLPTDACTVVSDAACMNPQNMVCDQIPASDQCLLTLRRAFTEPGSYCVNITLSDDASLALASTLVYVDGGSGTKPVSVVLTIVGFVALAAIVVGVILYRKSKEYKPIRHATDQSDSRLSVYFRQVKDVFFHGNDENDPLLKNKSAII